MHISPTISWQCEDGMFERRRETGWPKTAFLTFFFKPLKYFSHSVIMTFFLTLLFVCCWRGSEMSWHFFKNFEGIKFGWTSFQLSISFQVHTLDRVFQCSQCDKGFKEMRTLRLHLKIHNAEYPEQCGVCQKVFRTKWQLKQHQMDHGGERPYPCPECSFTCKTKQQLNEHRRKHSVRWTSGKSGPRPRFICLRKIRGFFPVRAPVGFVVSREKWGFIVNHSM